MEEYSQGPITTPLGEPVTVRTDRYARGGLAVELFGADDEPYTVVSVNVEGVSLADDEFVFKTYSENAGLLEVMLEAGVIETVGRSVEVGMAGPQPICRLNPAARTKAE